MIMKIQPASVVLALCLGLVTATILISLPGCVAGDRYNRSTGEYVDDKSIDSRVRDALNGNSEYKFDDVRVVAFKGTVQLSGFVDTYAQKYMAGDIARKVQGVRGIEDNISVKDGTDRSPGESIDDRSLASRITSALRNNEDYKFDEVAVVAYKGSVQLSGFVNNTDQKLKAEDIVRQVAGVQEIANKITVKDKL
jgi:hyperosmotically inducible protein